MIRKILKALRRSSPVHEHKWKTHLLDGSNDVSPFVDCKCGAQGVNIGYMGRRYQ